MGIPDEDSWFRQSYLPSGHATGWRLHSLRIGVGLLVFALLAGIVAMIIDAIAN